MQNLKEIYYSLNLDPLPNPDLLFLSEFVDQWGTGRCSSLTKRSMSRTLIMRRNDAMNKSSTYNLKPHLLERRSH